MDNNFRHSQIIKIVSEMDDDEMKIYTIVLHHQQLFRIITIKSKFYCWYLLMLETDDSK